MATWSEYILFRTLELFLRALPMSWAYRSMEAVFMVLFALIPRFRRRILESLHTAFGDTYTESALDKLYQDTVRYQSWFFADMILLPRLLRNPRYAAQVDGSEAIAALSYLGALKETGVLIVASHQGAPDIMSLFLGMSGWPITVIVRNLDNVKLDLYVTDLRRGFQREQLSKRGALRPAFRILEDHGIVGAQVDQDAGPNGVFVPYFGKLASTHAGAATLALLAEVPVLMLHCIRTQPRSFSFKIYAEIVEAVPSGLSRNEEIQVLTARFTQSVERMARRFPQQVMWGHRRWKTRPSLDSKTAPSSEPSKKRDGVLGRSK